MFDALKAPNLPRFARITAVEVASHRRGDNVSELLSGEKHL